VLSTDADAAAVAAAASRHFATREGVELGPGCSGLRAFVERFNLYAEVAALSADGSDDFVRALVQSDRVSDWASLEALLGERALETILLSCDLAQATPKMLAAIAEVAPLVARVVTMANDGVAGRRVLHLALLERAVAGDAEMAAAIAGRPSMKYAWAARGIAGVRGHERLLFDNFCKYFREHSAVREDALWALLDLADQVFRCDLPDYVVARLFEDACTLTPFPTGFTEELRMRCAVVDANAARLEPAVRREIFPETVTPFSDAIAAAGADEADAVAALAGLIAAGDLGLAAQFAGHRKVLAEFGRMVVERVGEILAGGGDLADFFGEERALAQGVFERLPHRLRMPENEVKLLALAGGNRVRSLAVAMNLRRADSGRIQKFDPSSLLTIADFVHCEFRHLSERAQIVPQIVVRLTALAEQICVSTVSDEVAAFGTLRKIDFLLAEVSQKSPIVSWLLEFVSRSFSLRFGARYSFEGAFGSATKLLPVCFRYDDFGLLSSARSAWPSLDITEYLQRECCLCFWLGQTQAAVPFIDDKGICPAAHAGLQWIVGVLLHPLPCGIRRNAEIISVDLTPMDYWVRRIIGGEAPVALPRENIDVSERLIRAFGGELALVEAKAAKADFALAFAKPLALQD
jgi:hypothetical protein